MILLKICGVAKDIFWSLRIFCAQCLVMLIQKLTCVRMYEKKLNSHVGVNKCTQNAVQLHLSCFFNLCEYTWVFMMLVHTQYMRHKKKKGKPGITYIYIIKNLGSNLACVRMYQKIVWDICTGTYWSEKNKQEHVHICIEKLPFQKPK